VVSLENPPSPALGLEMEIFPTTALPYRAMPMSFSLARSFPFLISFFKLPAFPTSPGSGACNPVSRSVAESPWRNIRYQLLTVLCGNIFQRKSEESTLTVLAIHEFQTDETLLLQQTENHLGLETLFSVVYTEIRCLESGNLYGPFNIACMDCMIGKVIIKL